MTMPARFGTADEIGEVIDSLARLAASRGTGTNIVVDGGCTAVKRF